MPSQTIQGSNAILYVFTNSWIEVACYSTFELDITADIQSVKTSGDGYWSKNAYKGLSYTLTLSNVLKTTDDKANFSGYDFLDNILGFTEIQYKITYIDDANNIKSIQGKTLVAQLNFLSSITDIVKNNITLTGNGALLFYDGAVPCPVSIDTVTIAGQTSGDGNISVTYTYTGPLYQVQYRLDGTGPYSYALLAAPITFSSLAVGNHFIEMTPLCQNGYLANTVITNFQVTYAMVCTLQVTSLTTLQTGDTTAVTVNFNADPSLATLRYSLNDFPDVKYTGVLTNPTILYFTGLTPIPAPYSITVTPTCANGVDGTSNHTTFAVTGGTPISIINWNYVVHAPNTVYQIFKNGILLVSQTNTTASGSFTAVPTDSINILETSTFVPFSGPPFWTNELTVSDLTLSDVIFFQTYTVNFANRTGQSTFTFSPTSGHNFQIYGGTPV